MGMHLSILFYCIGFVTFVFALSNGIGSLGLGPFILRSLPLGYLVFGVNLVCVIAYVIVTLLPLRFLDCPYSTPYSAFWWCFFHLSSYWFFSAIRPMVLLVIRGRTEWLEKQTNKHKQKFWDGLYRTVELHGIEAQQRADANALEWTLKAPVKNKTENSAALVPEFFDDYALRSDLRPTNPTFVSRLLTLLGLKTYIQGKSAREHKERLRVSLKCLWCWVRVYNRNAVSLPSDFPLPDTDMIRRLQDDQDPTSGTIGRCFGALVAKNLATDINSSHDPDAISNVRRAKLQPLLSAILGPSVETFLGQPGAVSLASIIFLTPREGVKQVPSDVLDIFRTTIRILAEDILTLPKPQPEPHWRDLVALFDNAYSRAQRFPALDPLTDQLRPIKEKLDALNAGELNAGDGYEVVPILSV
ncbi:hypothetical protein H4582DRAFT_1979022 [Lactarius indigo]|nr:hypothetical protein H4582DRAFT_1979022 [Lactarius indigo]